MVVAVAVMLVNYVVPIYHRAINVQSNILIYIVSIAPKHFIWFT